MCDGDAAAAFIILHLRRRSHRWTLGGQRRLVETPQRAKPMKASIREGTHLREPILGRERVIIEASAMAL